MLLKIYATISILNVIVGLKLTHDIKKNTKFSDELKSSYSGRLIYERYRRYHRLIINSLIPVIHIFDCFERSFFFIFNIFNSEKGNKALLEAINEQNKNN